MEEPRGKAKLLVEAAMRLPDSVMDRGIKILAVLTVIAIVGLGAYYYMDRFYFPAPAPQDQELKALEAAVLDDPQNPEARVRVAWAYTEQGMLDHGIEQFSEALKLRDNYQAALIGRGTALVRKGDMAGAQASFEQVAALNENNPYRKTLRELQAVYYYLGTIYAQQRREDESIAAFKEALDIDRADADSLYGLGMVYAGKGEFDAARPLLEQVVRFDPAYSDGYKGLGAVYDKLAMTGHSLWVKAMLNFLQGKYDESLDQLRQSSRVEPNLAETYQAMGLVYDKKNLPNEALQAFRTALEKDPSLPLAQAGVARYSR